MNYDEDSFATYEGGPPTPKQIAIRALCIGSVVMRAEFETELSDDPPEEDRASHIEGINRINQWIIEQNLSDHFTPGEIALIAKKPGEWSLDEAFEGSWRLEALGMLMWSLGLTDFMPEWDEPFNLDDIMPRLHLGAPVKKLLLSIKPLGEEEIKRQCRIAEIWHWRMRATMISREDQPECEPCRMTPEISEAAQAAYEKEFIPEVMEDDFVAFDKPVHKLESEEFVQLTSITVKRHLACQWLNGAFDRYYNSPPPDMA